MILLLWFVFDGKLQKISEQNVMDVHRNSYIYISYFHQHPDPVHRGSSALPLWKLAWWNWMMFAPWSTPLINFHNTFDIYKSAVRADAGNLMRTLEPDQRRIYFGFYVPLTTRYYSDSGFSSLVPQFFSAHIHIGELAKGLTSTTGYLITMGHTDRSSPTLTDRSTQTKHWQACLTRLWHGRGKPSKLITYNIQSISLKT